MTAAGGRQEAGKTPDIAAKPGSDLHELASRLRHAEGMTSDEVSELVSQYWQRLVVGVLIVAGGIWLFGQLRSNQERRLADASERFSQAQDAFATLHANPPADAGASSSASDTSADKLRAFNDTLGSLRDTYSQTKYDDLGGLYDAAFVLGRGDAAKALEKLNGVKTAPYFEENSAAPAELNADSFRNELGALIYARAKLALNRDEGRKLLGLLTKRSSIVNVEALLALARVSTNEAERKETGDLARALIESRPELAGDIRSELSSLGYTL